MARPGAQVCYSPPKTVEWGTPSDFFDVLHREFHFTLDVAANADNTKCERYFTIEDDGLAQDWGRERCWMNPPYGREIVHWMRKAYESSLRGALVVCLVPARTDTGWWWDYVFDVGAEVRFIRGRLRFDGGTKTNPKSHNAPFPVAVVIHHPHLNGHRSGRINLEALGLAANGSL